MKKNPIESFDPHILDGCENIDMPSLKYVSQSFFCDEIKNCPYEPIKIFIESTQRIRDMKTNTTLYSIINDNRAIRDDLKNLSTLNSKIMRIVFDEKSFVGSKVEIASSILWMIQDLGKILDNLREHLKRVKITKDSNELNDLIRLVMNSQEASDTIFLHYSRLKQIVDSAYSNKL